MQFSKRMIVDGDYLFKKRSIIPVYILVIGILVKSYGELYGNHNNFIIDEFYYEIIAFIISLFGFIIRVYTVAYTPLHSSGKHTIDGPSAKVLNTTGSYSLVRHPLYIGNFFMWFGVTMLTDNFWFIVAFVLFYILYYERILLKEEDILIKTFGSYYVSWSEKVNLITPNFKNFINSSLLFSWKKVLKSEKNSIAALGIIFWFFNTLENLLRYKELSFQLDFWFYFMVITSLAYMILKILKLKGYLNEENR